jgi:chromate reductase
MHRVSRGPLSTVQLVSVRILAISGSLRAGSSNGVLLEAAARLAPPEVELVLYDGVGSLPHFNPDLDRSLDDPALPLEVRALRRLVGECEALLISSPEYAHGVPGSLKNALDWLVGSAEFPGKPVALLNASPSSVFAQASLTETLKTMSAVLVEGSPFLAPLRRGGASVDEALADASVAATLRAAMDALARAAGAAADAPGFA